MLSSIEHTATETTCIHTRRRMEKRVMSVGWGLVRANERGLAKVGEDEKMY